MVGERCMVLSDFLGIEAGTKGAIVEICDGGVIIEWDDTRGDMAGRDRHKRSEAFIFNELQYLAFETKKHPNVDPEVTNINRND